MTENCRIDGQGITQKGRVNVPKDAYGACGGCALGRAFLSKQSAPQVDVLERHHQGSVGSTFRRMHTEHVEGVLLVAHCSASRQHHKLMSWRGITKKGRVNILKDSYGACGGCAPHSVFVNKQAACHTLSNKGRSMLWYELTWRVELQCRERPCSIDGVDQLL